MRKRCHAEALGALKAHAWPGNVRELQNTVRNVVVLNEGETVEIDMLPRSFQGGVGGVPVADHVFAVNTMS